MLRGSTSQALLLVSGLVACAESRTNQDASALDAVGEVAAEAALDARDDGALVDAADATDGRQGVDAPTADEPDVASDVAPDLLVDAPTPPEASADVSPEGSVDATMDAAPEVGLDVRSDIVDAAPLDAPMDARLDATLDVGPDLVPDAPSPPVDASAAGAGRWTYPPTDLPRMAHGATRGVWTGRELVVWGTYQARIFTVATSRWSSFSSAGAPPGMATPLSVYDIAWDATTQRLYVLGNASSAMLMSEPLYTYDFPTSTWATPSSMGPIGRRRQVGIAVGGGRLFAFGGVTVRTTQDHNSGGLYTFATRTWTSPPLPDTLVERHLPVVEYTGSEFLVYGGISSALGARNDGALYNPNANTWRPMSPVGAPSPRRYAANVWTGTDLYVWGGVDSTGMANPLADGARYNVASNTWSPITPSPLDPRFGPAGAWTGSELFLWGGATAALRGAGPATGALYNPVTGTWRSLMPSSRGTYFAGAAWMGEGVMVAGGQDLNDPYSPPPLLWRP